MALVDSAILPPGTYQSNDPDFIDLDLALEKQERTLMELVYGYLTAEAERGCVTCRKGRTCHATV